MMVAALVLADVIVGMADASTTRRPRTPRTRSCGSSTDVVAAHAAGACGVEHGATGTCGKSR